MFSVETHSFLPDQQSDRGNLPGQRQTRHRWLHATRHHGRVEILQRSGGDRRTRSRALENILQIVIVISIQPTDRNRSLRSLDLSRNVTIVAAAVGLQTKPAVGPQLLLGAKTLRRLHGMQHTFHYHNCKFRFVFAAA